MNVLWPIIFFGFKLKVLGFFWILSLILVVGYMIYRFYDKKTSKALADVIALHDEIIPEDNYTIFDQTATWKKKTLTNYTIRPLQEKIFDNGILVYTSPALKEIAENAKAELNTLWNEVKRMKNPHKYYVDLSQELWNLKDNMLHNL